MSILWLSFEFLVKQPVLFGNRVQSSNVSFHPLSLHSTLFEGHSPKTINLARTNLTRSCFCVRHFILSQHFPPCFQIVGKQIQSVVLQLY